MNQRGGTLTTMMALSAIASIASYAMIINAISNARHTEYHESRTRARYLAEVGTVFARERLWADPTYAGGPLTLDFDGDTVVESDETVIITVTNPGAGREHEIIATVPY